MFDFLSQSENGNYFPFSFYLSIDENFQNDDSINGNDKIIDKNKDDIQEISSIFFDKFTKIDKNEDDRTIKTKKSSNNYISDIKTETQNTTPKKTQKRKRDRSHSKNSYDNILRKIIANFNSFLIFYANAILKTFCNFKLSKISYKYTKNANKSYIKDLKNKTISEILCQTISDKYKSIKNKEKNKLFIELYINSDPEKKEIFSQTYINLFKNIYYKGKREIVLEINGEKKIISLKGIQMFDDFLKKISEKGDNFDYIQRIKNCVKVNFLN